MYRFIKTSFLYTKVLQFTFNTICSKMNSHLSEICRYVQFNMASQQQNSTGFHYRRHCRGRDSSHGLWKLCSFSNRKYHTQAHTHTHHRQDTVRKNVFLKSSPLSSITRRSLQRAEGSAAATKGFVEDLVFSSKCGQLDGGWGQIYYGVMRQVLTGTSLLWNLIIILV